MRKIFSLSVLLTLVFVSTNAWSQDVEVDLSALDGIGASAPAQIQPQPIIMPIINQPQVAIARPAPQFPIIKETPKKRTPKKAVQPKKKAAPKVEKPVVTVTTPEVTAKQIIPSDDSGTKEPIIVYEAKVEDEITIPSKEDINAADAAIERSISDNIIPQIETPIEQPEPEVAAPVEPQEEASDDDSSETPREHPLYPAQPEHIPAQETILPTVAEPAQDAQLFDSEDKDSIAPIHTNTIEQAPLPEAKVNNRIYFAPDSSVLSEADKRTIDALIASFENPQANKIGIFAYNYDDGVDSFKKKRLSLNRAIEIRSYLLGKGYKSFSIKVVNINTDRSKENLVEIEEVK